MLNACGRLFLVGILLLFGFASGVEAAKDYSYLLTAPLTSTTDPATSPVLTVVTASSSAAGYVPYNLVNNAGMTGTMYPQDRHNASSADMWMTAANDTEPAVTFDLGEIYPLGKMLVWNFNAFSGGVSYGGRGIRHCHIEHSIDGANWTQLGGGIAPDGRFELARAEATGSPTPATNQASGGVVDFAGAAARYVRIRALDNWGGASPDGANQYYGLSAVRIYRYASPVAASGDHLSAKVIVRSSAHPENAAAERVVSNYDMSDAGTGLYRQDATVGTQARWMTAANDPQPHIILDLGGTYPIDRMVVWNYNHDGQTGRGIRNATIYHRLGNPRYNIDDVWAPLRGWERLNGPNSDRTWTFAQSQGLAAQPATGSIPFGNVLARYVMIVPRAELGEGNWGGVQPEDGGNVHIGLSQIRFYAGEGIVVEPLPYWRGLYGQRSQSGAIWGGADGNHSIPFPGPDGSTRYYFSFSDTFRDTWNPRTYQRPQGLFQHSNSSAVYSGPVTLTPSINDMTFYPLREFIPDPARWPNSYYWLNGGVYVESLNRIFVVALRALRGSVGSVADHLVALPVENGEIQWDDQEQYDTGHRWVSQDGTITHHFSTAMLDNSASDGYIYIYGNRTIPDPFWGTIRRMIVARVTPQNMVNFSEWRFYNGSAWVAGSQNAASIADNQAGNFAVGAPAVVPAPDPEHAGQFMAFTMEAIIGDLAISYSPNPWGPFLNFRKIYSPHETNPKGNPDFLANGTWWYGEAAHPHLSAPGELIFSYCTNAALGGYNRLNADLYRPRIINMRTIGKPPTAAEPGVWPLY